MIFRGGFSLVLSIVGTLCDNNGGNVTFDPIKLLTKECDMSPTLNLPKIEHLPLEILAIFHIDRFLEINDVRESYSVRAVVTLQWQLDCLKNLYSSPQWPNMEETYDKGNSDLLWTPNIMHRNSRGTLNIVKNSGKLETYLIQMKTGQVVLNFFSLYESTCDMNFYEFPFDIQTCWFTLTSMHSNKTIAINTEDGVIDDLAIPNNFDWDLLTFKTIASIESWNYNSETNVHFEFSVKRLPNYFSLNLLAPAVILQLLELSSFLIPPDTPDRATYAITIMLSLYVLRTEMLSYLPKTPQPIVVAFYLLGATVFAMFIALYSAVVCYLIGKYPTITHHKHFRQNWSKIGLIELLFATISSLFLVIFNLFCAFETGLINCC